MKRLRRFICGSTVVASAMCVACSAMAADSGGINARDALQDEQLRNAEILEDTQTPRVKPVDLNPYMRFKENLSKSTGIDYLVYYTLMGHKGTNSGTPSSNVNGQVHAIAAWTPRQESKNAGTAVFYFMSVEQYSKTTGSQLSGNLGLTSTINDSTDDVNLFRLVGWRQPFANEKVELFVGQFLLRDIYDFGDYASDDTRNFISQIMSANPSATLPAPGLGAAVKFSFSDQWSIGGGFSDANAVPGDLLDFDSFSKGDYAKMGYLNYRPKIPGFGEGNYQLNVYSVDATDNAGSSHGVSLILEQDISDDYAAFIKYNRAGGRRADVKQSFAAAFVLNGVHVWKDDLLGIGAGWGEPTDSELRTEYIIEAFWRMQVTPSVQIAPDIQIWFNPSRAPDTAIEAVFSLRTTIDF
jgi:Carbohydrate-selective porin, OprB family